MSDRTDRRPRLRRVPLSGMLPPRSGFAYVTMSEGQWNTLLATAYRTGWVLLEVDEDENIVRAYRRPDPERN
jgi:hypothetical protein